MWLPFGPRHLLGVLLLGQASRELHGVSLVLCDSSRHVSGHSLMTGGNVSHAAWRRLTASSTGGLKAGLRHLCTPVHT